MKNNFLLSCHGKFHYFEIAKVLYKNDQLSQIVSGYPWFKLKNENLPKNKVTIVAFGIFTILAVILGKISPSIFEKLIKKLHNIKRKKYKHQFLRQIILKYSSPNAFYLEEYKAYF